MRAKVLALAAIGFLALVTSSQAGWHGGCYGGGWHGGGGYCGPGWGWGGWGWGGPSLGISFVQPAPVYYAPPPVYRTVYYAQPAPAYYYNNGAPVLAAAQRRLAKLGYYNGYIDGDFGPRTNRALIQYQADYGLPVTGRLDSRTRASLGV